MKDKSFTRNFVPAAQSLQAMERVGYSMYYIATFYSHFGAIRFKKICQKENLDARMMPVPRDLSSSCGTCVRFEAAVDYCVQSDGYGEMEQLVRVEADGYTPVYKAKES